MAAALLRHTSSLHSFLPHTSPSLPSFSSSSCFTCPFSTSFPPLPLYTRFLHPFLPSSSSFSSSPSPDPDAAVAEAIYEVEVLVREPQVVLDGMKSRLSSKDLESILLYFSKDGRDAWYALEIFDWMQVSGRASEGTRDLMMSIMFKWLMNVVASGGSLPDVQNLLHDMACVGLQPEPDILHALVIAYWDRGSKKEALDLALQNAPDDEHCIVALMWRMIETNDQPFAMEVISHLRKNQEPKISFSIYNMALVAAILEQQQLTRTLRKLVTYQKRGIVKELGGDETSLIEEYEERLHKKAERIASWALEDHPRISASYIHKKLLAIYCIAGRGLKAMQKLWHLKLAQETVPVKLFNTVLGICAYQNHSNAIKAILSVMKTDGPAPDKMSYEAIFGGFVNGGHVKEAILIFLEMLDQGFFPDRNLTATAMKQVSKLGDIQLVYKFGKRLVQAQLVDPFVVYLDIDQLNLCIIILL